MNYEQRNAVVAIFTNLAVTIYIATKLFALHDDGQFAGDGGLTLFAQTVLWVIPISIVVTIVASILFNIIWAIATRTPKPSFVVDERDKQIGIFAMRVTVVVLSAGFIISMILLALGWAALPVFIVLFFGFSFGDLAGNIARFGYYRWGN